jgi:hypothetical protein
VILNRWSPELIGSQSVSLTKYPGTTKSERKRMIFELLG